MNEFREGEGFLSRVFRRTSRDFSISTGVVEINRRINELALKKEPRFGSNDLDKLAESIGEESIPFLVQAMEEGANLDIGFCLLSRLVSSKDLPEISRLLKKEEIYNLDKGYFSLISSCFDSLVPFFEGDEKQELVLNLQNGIQKAIRLMDRLISERDKSGYIQRINIYIRCLCRALLVIDFKQAEYVKTTTEQAQIKDLPGASDTYLKLIERAIAFDQAINCPSGEEKETVVLETKREDTKKIEQWKAKIKRLLRRSIIARNLEKETLHEIKTAVRQLEKDKDADSLLDILIKEEYAVVPSRAKAAEGFSVFMRENDPRVLAFVMVGSSVHGGALIRGMFDNQYRSDIDWGIIIKEPLSDLELKSTETVVVTKKEYILTTAGLSSCGMDNDLRYWAKNLEKIEDVYRLFLSSDFISSFIFLYLQPSYPSEVNEKNRLLIKEALVQLRKTNKRVWEEVVSEMIYLWQEVHLLKDKHFLQEEAEIDPKNRRLLREILAESPSIMLRPLDEMLRKNKN